MKTQTAAKTSDEVRAILATQNRPVEIAKILVPVDFSPASEKSLKYAQRLAEKFHSELILLHVVEPCSPIPFNALPVTATPEQKTIDAKENLLELAQSTQVAEGWKARWNLRTGVATHEIVEGAKELNVDLIVIGAHGFDGWKHFAIGSTADRVARAAPCPVLVVREKEHDFI